MGEWGPGALDDAGLTKDDVDAVFTAGNWAWAPPSARFKYALLENLGKKDIFKLQSNRGGQ
jgi:hypothetical protein